MKYSIASEYPQIPFIMAHLGSFASGDWTEHVAAINVAKRFPNIYLDTSSVVFFRFLEMAAREAPERLVFGSDGPELDSRVEWHKARLLKFAPAVEERVLGGNVERLLPKGAV